MALPTGDGNAAIGWGAGAKLSSGNQNIYLGHPGVATESNTMRLGSNLQTKTFIAGVAGHAITGNTVLINSNGRLGVLLSSARYKQNIQPLADQQSKLQRLRPVTFHYKEEPSGPLQYGLIAEEVAEVYPELVTTDANGQIESVQYHELIPMLLDEVQRQQQTLQQQQQRLTTQQQELTTLYAQNVQLRAALAQQQETIMARLEQLEAAAAKATLATR